MDIFTKTCLVGLAYRFTIKWIMCCVCNLLWTLTKKCWIPNSNTKICNYTIMGVGKGHLGHGHHILATNHFSNFAKRSYHGRVNMVTSPPKRKQCVWLPISDERSHVFQTPTPLPLHTLGLLLRKILKHQLRLLLTLRELQSNSN